MEILTIRQAAGQAGITPAGLYQAIQRGEVKPVEVLGRLGVTLKELGRFIQLRAKRPRRGPKANGSAS